MVSKVCKSSRHVKHLKITVRDTMKQRYGEDTSMSHKRRALANID